MIKAWGRLIWRQPREMSVLNYANHIVYEIYTNNGYVYVSQNKDTQKIEVQNGFSISVSSFGCSKSGDNESEKDVIPRLQ